MKSNFAVRGCGKVRQVRHGGVKLGWLRAVTPALILATGLVAVDGVAASSTAPRPDPPPVKKTPPPSPRPDYRTPPPVYQAPPPVYQAPPPPTAVAEPPPASGPTAAQVLAAQRAVARAKAARRAARLKKQRREARRKQAAARLAAATRAAEKRELARRDASTRVAWDAADGDRAALPFVGAATVAALIILGIGLVPAQVVPWYRMSVALENHREHLTLGAGIALLGAAISFALTLLSS